MLGGNRLTSFLCVELLNPPFSVSTVCVCPATRSSIQGCWQIALCVCVCAVHAYCWFDRRSIDKGQNLGQWTTQRLHRRLVSTRGKKKRTAISIQTNTWSRTAAHRLGRAQTAACRLSPTWRTLPGASYPSRKSTTTSPMPRVSLVYLELLKSSRRSWKSAISSPGWTSIGS